MLCHVGHAASEDLISSGDSPVGLCRLITHLSPFVARAAADAAYELIQNHGRFDCSALKPFIRAAAVHHHWYGRCWAAQHLYGYPSIRLVAHLLSDPSGAVAANVALSFGDESIPQSAAVRLCRALSRKSPRNAVYMGMVFKRMGKNWQYPDYALELCKILIPSGQHECLREKIEQRLTTARTLSHSQLLEVPAEELLCWLIVGKESTLSASQICWIAQKHPDPIARQAVLEEMPFHLESEEQFWLALARGMKDEHPAVRLTAAKLAWAEVGIRSYRYLTAPLMRLTHDPCLRIVQVAVHSMRECCDVETPSPAIVHRLLSLASHPDPLVRVNALYARQGFPLPPSKVVKELQRLWTKEEQSVVRAAVAETMWWLMPLKDWLPLYGVALVTSGRRDWRNLAVRLFERTELGEVKEAVNLLPSGAAQRFFQRRLSTMLSQSEQAPVAELAQLRVASGVAHR
jgi:hypothetical protein